MAHFKRKRPRKTPTRGYSRNGLKNRLGPRYDDGAWLRNYPRFWDKIHHSRPARRQAKQAEREILKGGDPDGLAWPDGKRPHIYYW